MSEGWTVTSLESLERIPLEDGAVDWLPVRAALGIQGFGVNAWTGSAGAEIVGPHDESDDFAGGHEELYLVISGAAVFSLGAAEIDAPAGTLVFVRDRSLRRRAVACDDGTILLAVGSPVGAPFSVAPWEFIVRASADARRGELDAAISAIREGLAACPGSAELLYHLACYESLAGHLTEAGEHLDEAVARDASMRARAEGDPDLERLREHLDSSSVGAGR